MSTHLELLAAMHRECGGSGAAPTVVTGLTGEALLFDRWVIEADIFVQNLWHNWKFLFDSTYSAALSAGVATLTAPATLRMWDEETIRMDGELITVQEYHSVRNEVHDLTTQDVPARILIMPNNDLRADPVPDGANTITADQYVKPVRMVAAGDVSLIPALFHDTVLLGRAMMMYGNQEEADGITTQGLEYYDSMIGQLESLQLPNNFNSRYRSDSSIIEVIAE